MKTKRRHKWLRRTLVAGGGLAVVMAVLGSYLYWGVVPRDRIALLADSYVDSHYEHGRVHYAIVSEMPETWTPSDPIPKDARRFVRSPGFSRCSAMYAS